MTLVYRSTVGRRLTVSEGDGNISELSGAAGISFLQVGTGAQTETVENALRRFVHTAQYDTQGNFEAATKALTGGIGFPNSVYLDEVSAINWLPGGSNPGMYLGGNTVNSGVTNAVDADAVLVSLLSNDTDATADKEIGALRFEKNLSGGGFNAAFIRGYQDDVSGGDSSGYLTFETKWRGAGVTDAKVRLGDNPYSLEVLGILRVMAHSGGTAGTMVLEGGQITFTATQSPAAGANVLDDYEEGTFTPGISSGGGATGITYSVQVGAYQKVGNQVTVMGYVNLSDNGSSTGSAKVTGLPFASAHTTNLLTAVSIKGIAFITITGHIQGYVEHNATTFVLEQFGTCTVSSLDESNLGNTAGVIFNASYRAAN